MRGVLAVAAIELFAVVFGGEEDDVADVDGEGDGSIRWENGVG